MRLPNGYGSVTKLSGKRRKPYIARISNGYTHDLERDRIIVNRVIIGYFKTKKEALDALAEYHAKPYDLAKKDMTFKQIYDIVLEKKYQSCQNTRSRYIGLHTSTALLSRICGYVISIQRSYNM